MNPVMQRLQAMMGGDPKRFQAMAAPVVVVPVLYSYLVRDRKPKASPAAQTAGPVQDFDQALPAK